MRPITSMMAQFKADTQSGENLQFELCKGGYFSDREEYGLKVVGKTEQDGTPSPDNPVPIQCVKAGTKVQVTGKNLVGKNSDAVSNGAYISIPLDQRNAYTLSIKRKPNMDVPNGGYIGLAYKYADSISWVAEWLNVNGEEQRPYCSINTRIIYDLCFAVYPAKKEMWNAFFAAYDIQLELGTEPTEFEPYISGGELVTPCDLYEGDIWWPMTGKVERHSWTKEFDGSELWYEFGNRSIALLNPFEYPSEEFSYSSSYKGMKSNRFTFVSASPENGLFASHNVANVRWIAVNMGLSLSDSKMMLAEWKDALQPMMVTYKLKEPILEQYDPQPIFAPPGTVNVLQTPAELPAALSATMLVKGGIT